MVVFTSILLRLVTFSQKTNNLCLPDKGCLFSFKIIEICDILGIVFNFQLSIFNSQLHTCRQKKLFLFIKRAVYFQKLTAGGDAELAVKVFVVEIKGVFLDVKLFQDLFSVLAADVGVKDEPLGGGKGAKAAGEIFEGLGGRPRMLVRPFPTLGPPFL